MIKPLKFIQNIIKVFKKYFNTSKFAIISSIVAFFATIIISVIYIPKILINNNSTQIEITNFINKATIIVLILNILLIYFIFTMIISLMKFLIKESIINDNKPGKTFTLMFLIIFLTVFSFGYIYYFSEKLLNTYTNLILAFESIISKFPNVELSDFNQNLINFIKNSDPEFNIIFKTQKEAIKIFDYYLFSAVTFFSGNYTTIIPNNIIVQILVLLENITTFIITIVYIPITLNLIQVNKKKEQTNDNHSNIKLRLQQGNATLVYELKEYIVDKNIK